MATTSFCLLMLVLTPWMVYGRPAEESVQPDSQRNSRQMLLPYLPIYQPSFQNYEPEVNPMATMTPAAKRQLIQALLATSSALSTQPFDQSGFKTTPNQKNGVTSLDFDSKMQQFDAGTLSALDIQNMGLSPEILKQFEGRLSLQSLMGVVVQSVTNAILQTIINQIFG